MYIYMYTYMYIYKTQYLPISFARRLLQGIRIYRFISICELCLQLENLTSYRLGF